MGKDLDGERCIRKIIPWNGDSFYLTVTDKSIMFFGPCENTIQHQEKFSHINLICRLASKLRANGVPWKTVLEQFDKVNVTYGQLLVGEIARCVRETPFVEEN